MPLPKKNYLVVCEGKSELVYIQELNRFLDDNNYNFTLIPKMVGCGHYTEVIRKYKKVKESNKKADIIIWVDKDTYFRNDKNDKDKYARKSNKIPDFYFSTQNFEDFLVLHLDTKILNDWMNICFQRNHHKIPMKKDTYLPLFQQHLFPNYNKGNLPFEITAELLKCLFKNNKDNRVFFKCQFASFIKEKMDKYSP